MKFIPHDYCSSDGTASELGANHLNQAPADLWQAATLQEDHISRNTGLRHRHNYFPYITNAIFQDIGILSPNDWQLGGSFPRKIVLTMYQVTGTKGWGGKQLWVPNIKLPEGSVYYDVIED